MEHAPGTRVGADQFGQRAHLRRRGADVPRGAAQKVVVEGGHNQRTFGADYIQNRVDDGLRPAFHAAGRARERGIGRMHKDGVAAGHTQGAEVGGEGGFGEHGETPEMGWLMVNEKLATGRNAEGF